jgi:hypothetical protein
MKKREIETSLSPKEYRYDEEKNENYYIYRIDVGPEKPNYSKCFNIYPSHLNDYSKLMQVLDVIKGMILEANEIANV